MLVFVHYKNDKILSPGQTIATLLGITCYVRLATVLRCVATCCDMLGVVGSNLTSFKLEPTTRNMLQHVATGWPNARNMLRPTMLGYVALNVAIVWPGLYISYALWRCVVLMVSAFIFESSGLGWSPGWGHCAVFLGKTLYSRSAFLHRGV